MHTFGEKHGVKFRINHDRPMTMETLKAIDKMVELAAKKFNNEPNDNNRQTTRKRSHQK